MRKLFSVITSLLFLANSLLYPFSFVYAQDTIPTSELTVVAEETVTASAEPAITELTQEPTVSPIVDSTSELTVVTEETSLTTETPTQEPSQDLVQSDEPTQSSEVKAITTENAELGVVILDNQISTLVDEFDFSSQQDGSATLITDKADYAPGEIALITGTGFLPNTEYTIEITSDTGNYKFSDTVTSDESGGLFYSYQLENVYRPNYLVEVKSGDKLISTVSFTDSRIINSVTLNGGPSVTVAPGASITAIVNVTTDNGGGNNDWQSTSWRISTTVPGLTKCVNTNDETLSGIYNKTITITAPSTTGTYNAYFIVYSDDSCSQGGSSVKTLSNSVIVANSNQAPVAVNDTYTATEDTTLSISAPGVLSNDTDSNGDSLTAIKVTDPSNGSITLNSNGSFTYIPALNYFGSDSFTYKANDTKADSNIATVNITVNAVNDAPTISSVSNITINEDNPTGSIAISIADIDNALGSLVMSGTSSNTSLLPNANIIFGGSGANRTAVITPLANQNGTSTITFIVSDGLLTASTSFTLTVNAVNDAPVAYPDSYSVNDNTNLNVIASGVLSNDIDIDSLILTANLVSNVSNGTLTLNSNGSFSYKSIVNYNGVDSFTYKANDGSLDSNIVTVTINVSDKTLPETTINSGPSGYVSNTSATLEFSANETSTFECQIDGGGYIVCTSPKTYTSLTQGSHTFNVRAVDIAGNVDTTPEVRTWTVDTILPVLDSKTLFSGWYKTDQTSNFIYTDTNDPLTGIPVSCLISTEGFAQTCTVTTLNVCDIAGNCNTTPVTSNGADIDKTAPSAPEDLLTTSPTNLLSQTWNWTEPTDLSGILGYSWRIPGYDNHPVITNSLITSLTEGTWDLFVKAIDNAGNEGDEASGTVIVDTTNPGGNWTSPTAGSTVSGIVSLNFSATDNLSGVDNILYQYKQNNGLDAFHPTSSNWDTTTLALDAYTLKAIVTDNAGNSDEFEEIVYVSAIISGESSTTPTTDSAIITWTTNMPTKSRVVYDTVSPSVLDSTLNYGYAFSTGTYDESPKVTSHSVTINGLSAGTLYYYRVISEGSPVAVGDEKQYRTLSIAGAPNPGGTGGQVAEASTVVVSNSQYSQNYESSTTNEEVLGETTESNKNPAPEVKGVTTKDWLKKNMLWINLGSFLIIIFIFLLLVKKRKQNN